MQFRKRAILFAGALILLHSLSAQTQTVFFPTIGKPCPDITLKNIKYYNKTEAKISEFRGKWLMLDIWERLCGGCIEVLPNRSKNRKEFKDKLEVIAVGVASALSPFPSEYENERKKTEKLFAQLVKKDTLDLPCSFNVDLGVQWDVGSVPYVVIIDPKGIVREITYNVPHDKLDSLLKGFSPHFDPATRGHEDNGTEARPPVGRTFFTSIAEPNIYAGPRFAFANDNDFPVKIITDIPDGSDSISARGVGKFHEGDYRQCLQANNVTYEMSRDGFRGMVNAVNYDPKALKLPTPTGDWIIHFKWDKGWKVRAVKLNY